MKTYAVYEFDRTKKRFKQYKFLYSRKAHDPEIVASKIFKELYKQPPRTKIYDMKIKINDISYNGFAVAFSGINHEIVLAEIINQATNLAGVIIKTKERQTWIAESAITILKQGIEDNNKDKCRVAYDMIEDDNFSWDNLDVIFIEWNSLVEEATGIIFGE